MFPVLLGKNNETNKKIENVLPKVTNLDNGKLLTVINGVWGKASAPSSLPAVSAANNGDVLTVVEGEWAKAAPSAGILVVRAAGDAGTLDATWQEIFDADFAVFLPNENESEKSFSFLISVAIMGENQYQVVFSDMYALEYLFIATSADGYPSEPQHDDD